MPYSQFLAMTSVTRCAPPLGLLKAGSIIAEITLFTGSDSWNLTTNPNRRSWCYRIMLISDVYVEDISENSPEVLGFPSSNFHELQTKIQVDYKSIL